MRKKNLPSGARIITTYKALHEHLNAWSEGRIGLLIIVGDGGNGKTRSVKDYLGDRACVMEGGGSLWHFYLKLYEHKDELVVLDDADTIFASREGMAMVKILCQTEDVKSVSYNKQTSEIRAGEVPDTFQTKSRVCIIANAWPQRDPHIQAIESRGHLLYFAPGAEEQHRYAATFCQDQEVYDYVGSKLLFLNEMHLRHYWKAGELKAAGMNWKEYVDNSCMPQEKAIALQLALDKSFTSDNLRSKQYNALTGKSSRSFYRYLKNFQAEGRLPKKVSN